MPGRLAGAAQAVSAPAPALVMRGKPSAVRIFDVETSETLLTSADSISVPRIGESIRISWEANTEGLFRVLDVVWEFTVANGVSQLRQVVVKVGKDAGIADKERS